MALLGLVFGTGPKLKIAELDVEVAISETHESAVQVTQNPVENGVDITDHVQVLPRKLQIEGAISDTPISFLSGVRSVLSGAFNLLTTGDFGKSSTATAYDTLRNILNTKEIVEIATGFDLYENMIMTSLRVPRDANSGSVMRFIATFQEVVTVSSSLIAIPAGFGGLKNNLGKVQSKAATPSQSNGSVLSRATGLGG